MQTQNSPAIRARRPAWNNDRIVGQKRPLLPLKSIFMFDILPADFLSEHLAELDRYRNSRKTLQQNPSGSMT